MKSIEDVQKLLGEHAELFDYTVREGYVIAKPRNYLGSETFAKVAAIVRNSNGEYVSAGKESHFKFKIEEAKSTASASPQTGLDKKAALIKEAIAMWERHAQETQAWLKKVEELQN